MKIRIKTFIFFRISEFSAVLLIHNNFRKKTPRMKISLKASEGIPSNFNIYRGDQTSLTIKPFFFLGGWGRFFFGVA